MQNTVVYRWNFLLRTLFDVVPLLGTVYLWRALFASRGRAINGYEFHSMVFYFLLTILASNLITPTDDEWQIAADIRDGQINAYAIAMLAFWILEISTVVFIIYSFEYFLSGHMFPLDLAPGWLRGILEWLPFTYELFFPVAVFLEKVQGAMLWKGLLIQAGWVLVSWIIGQTMWSRGLRHYGAYGG